MSRSPTNEPRSGYTLESLLRCPGSSPRMGPEERDRIRIGSNGQRHAGWLVSAPTRHKPTIVFNSIFLSLFAQVLPIRPPLRLPGREDPGELFRWKFIKKKSGRPKPQNLAGRRH